MHAEQPSPGVHAGRDVADLDAAASASAGAAVLAEARRDLAVLRERADRAVLRAQWRGVLVLRLLIVAVLALWAGMLAPVISGSWATAGHIAVLVAVLLVVLRRGQRLAVVLAAALLPSAGWTIGVLIARGWAWSPWPALLAQTAGAVLAWRALRGLPRRPDELGAPSDGSALAAPESARPAHLSAARDRRREIAGGNAAAAARAALSVDLLIAGCGGVVAWLGGAALALMRISPSVAGTAALAAAFAAGGAALAWWTARRDGGGLGGILVYGGGLTLAAGGLRAVGLLAIGPALFLVPVAVLWVVAGGLLAWWGQLCERAARQRTG